MRERTRKVNIRGQVRANMYLEIDQDQERSREMIKRLYQARQWHVKMYLK